MILPASERDPGAWRARSARAPGRPQCALAWRRRAPPPPQERAGAPARAGLRTGTLRAAPHSLLLVPQTIYLLLETFIVKGDKLLFMWYLY